MQTSDAIPRDNGSAAFFDIDNTLIKGASIVILGVGLARRGFFSPAAVAMMVWKQVKFRISGTENAADVAQGRRMALSFIRGQKMSDLEALAEEIYDDSIGDRIYEATHEMAQLHLQAGQEVWLVSATPVQLAQVIARRNGFTGALGTVAEVGSDGLLTGELVGDILHGPGKRTAVEKLAEERGLDLSRCTAYSDSVNDIPMLTLTGTSVAINPDRKLRDEALSRGWAIRDYRMMRRAMRRGRLASHSPIFLVAAVLAGTVSALGFAGVFGKRG